MKTPLSLLLILALTACAGGSDSGSGPVDAVVLFAGCENPRPQACTREFAPVCGVLTNGQLGTFDNPCTACSNSTVIGHYPGACATSGMTACSDPRPEICTANFLPVCGQRAGGGTETFGNACQACGDRSVIGHFGGACP